MRFVYVFIFTCIATGVVAQSYSLNELVSPEQIGANGIKELELKQYQAFSVADSTGQRFDKLLVYRETYQYDEQGRLLATYSYCDEQGCDSVYQSRSTFRYNEQGDQILWFFERPTGNYGWAYDYTYDDSGLAVEKRTYYVDGNGTQQPDVYQLDESTYTDTLLTQVYRESQALDHPVYYYYYNDDEGRLTRRSFATHSDSTATDLYYVGYNVNGTTSYIITSAVASTGTSYHRTQFEYDYLRRVSSKYDYNDDGSLSYAGYSYKDTTELVEMIDFYHKQDADNDEEDGTRTRVSVYEYDENNILTVLKDGYYREDGEYLYQVEISYTTYDNE